MLRSKKKLDTEFTYRVHFEQKWWSSMVPVNAYDVFVGKGFDQDTPLYSPDWIQTQFTYLHRPKLNSDSIHAIINSDSMRHRQTG